MIEITPKTEIEARTKKLQHALVRQNLDGAILLLNADLFYFTGTVQNAYLFIPAAGESILMVKRGLERVQAECQLQHIVAVKSPKEIPAVLERFDYKNINRLGLELDVLPVNLYKVYSKLFSTVEFEDVSPLVKEVRSVKSSYEIDILKNAIEVMDEAFSKVPSLLQEGMTEIELAALFEAELRKGGYAGSCRMRAFNQELFYGNVCSGSSAKYSSFFDGPVGGMGTSPANPQGAGWKKIERNEPVYMDYTSIIRGYTGDQTRIFCIGDLPEKMQKAFDDILILQKEVLRNIKPGVLAEDIYLLALKLAEKMGYKDYFMGYKSDQVKFLGHGIGIELDEWPIFAKGIKTKIVPGMVFALEPKLVFEDGAIGTENSFLMTADGPQCLSKSPERIINIE